MNASVRVGPVLASAVAIAAIGVFAVVMLRQRDVDPTAVVLFGAAAMSSLLVGLVLLIRAIGNRIGPLLLATGTLLTMAFGLGRYALTGAAETPPLAGVAGGTLAAALPFVLPIVLGPRV